VVDCVPPASIVKLWNRLFLEIYGASNDQIGAAHQEKSCVLRRRTDILCFDVCIIGCVDLNYDFLLDCLIVVVMSASLRPV